MFENEENLYFAPSTAFGNHWTFVNIYRRLQDPLARLLNIIMKIKYQEAKQKAGLFFAIEPQR